MLWNPDSSPALPSFRGSGKITVFIPTWRCRRWLSRAITSVLNQTWSQIDLYVADDASGDIDDELLQRFPEVTFLRMREQGGPYRIANLLLSLTESEFVAFHDADDWSKPERFAAQVAYLRDRGLDGCGTWCTLVDMNGDPIGFATYPEQASHALRQGVGNSIFHPTTLYRRTVFECLGGFDDYTRFSADTEFFWRSCTAVELGNVQQFLYNRMTRPDSLTQTPETGIGSPARSAYLSIIRGAAESIRLGLVPAPAPGILLGGRPVRHPDASLVEWLRVGTGNTTLKTTLGQAS